MRLHFNCGNRFKKWIQFLESLTLLETQSVHDSINASHLLCKRPDVFIISWTFQKLNLLLIFPAKKFFTTEFFLAYFTFQKLDRNNKYITRKFNSIQTIYWSQNKNIIIDALVIVRWSHMGLGAKNDKITVSSLNNAYSHQDSHYTHWVSSSPNSPIAVFAFEEVYPILEDEVSVSLQVLCVD